MNAATGEYVREREILKNVLVASKADTQNLPPLVPDTHWYDDILHKIVEELRKLLHYFNFSGPNLTATALMRIFIVLAIAALIFSLIYILIQPFFSGRKSARGKLPIDLSKSEPTADFLEIRIKEALSMGNFALAGRLRWKLFLLRTHQQPDRTPGEILNSGTPTVGLSALQCYRLMFHEHREAPSVYRDLDQTLVRWETSTELQR